MEKNETSAGGLAPRGRTFLPAVPCGRLRGFPQPEVGVVLGLPGHEGEPALVRVLDHVEGLSYCCRLVLEGET